MEIWKDIPNYNGYYKVSNFGRIRSFYGKGRLLKPNVDEDGYFRVALSKEGKRKDYYCHRLVAMAFLPNADESRQINHIDGNKQNNNVDNLEWCTCRENIIHAINILNKRLKKVDKYDLDNNYIKTYKSIESASKENNIKSQHIWRCCKNIRPTAGGYIWKYSN